MFNINAHNFHSHIMLRIWRILNRLYNDFNFCFITGFLLQYLLIFLLFLHVLIEPSNLDGMWCLVFWFNKIVFLFCKLCSVSISFQLAVYHPTSYNILNVSKMLMICILQCKSTYNYLDFKLLNENIQVLYISFTFSTPIHWYTYIIPFTKFVWWYTE